MHTTNPRLDTALKRLVDRVPDVVFRYRLEPEPHVEYISDATTRLVGYTPEEYYADPDLGFKTAHPDDRERLAELVRTGDPTPAILRWYRKDGTLIWAGQRRSDHTGDGHTCEAHISNLRKKIEPDPRNPSRILTVRGGGYFFFSGPPAA